MHTGETMKYYIEIPEVHKAMVKVEAPAGISRENLLLLAQTEFDENGSDILEYSHTLEQDKWTTRTEEGDFVT